MSRRTYIGPFGRILPVPNDKEPEEITGPIDETRSTMATYTLPQPALLFGSDNRGFTDPLRYSSQRSSHMSSGPSSHEHTCIVRNDALPSVNQLLTPTTQPSIPPSPHQHSQSALLSNPDVPLSGQTHTLLQRPISEAFYTHNDAYQPSVVSHNASQRMHQPGSQNKKLLSGSHLYQAYPSNMKSGTLSSYLGDSSATLTETHYPAQTQPLPVAPGSYPNLIPSYPTDSPMMSSYQPRQALLPPSGESLYFSDRSSAHIRPGSPPGNADKAEGSLGLPVRPQPRVVREDVLPGEGPVWVYEDGSTCPKTIDGEVVNAQWGVTKAGKPRKRLAIACTTCREKKIKCDPALPKCAQCEKFGRECRYATAPRNQHPSPRIRSYESQAYEQSVKIKSEPFGQISTPLAPKAEQSALQYSSSRRDPSSAASCTRATSESPSKDQKPPSKKQKADVFMIPSAKDRSCASCSELGFCTGHLDFLQSTGSFCVWPTSGYSLFRFNENTNPYDVDVNTTTYYMDMYFLHINEAVHQMFSRSSFLSWCVSRVPKSADDLLLIYIMLALGSLFSRRRNCQSDSQKFINIAHAMMLQRQVRCNLQLAQSHVLIGIYHIAIGAQRAAWSSVGHGLRAIMGLKLNLESECESLGDSEESFYGLQAHGLVECLRRTYWTIYIIERYCFLPTGHPPMLKDCDTFLRLPCEDEIYARQARSEAPFFDNGIVDGTLCLPNSFSSVGTQAHLVQISSIWEEVFAYKDRYLNSFAGDRVDEYEKFYQRIYRRVDDWSASLPEGLQYSLSNAMACVGSGEGGYFLGIHTLHKATMMRLNRSFHPRRIGLRSRRRNFHEARKHAQATLDILRSTADRSASKGALSPGTVFVSDLVHPSQLTGSMPMPGYAALLAIDILSAGGSLRPAEFNATLLSMTEALATLEDLGRYWSSVLEQSRSISRRIEALAKSGRSETAQTKKVWRCKTTLDDAFAVEYDMFYSHHVDSQWISLFSELTDTNFTEDEILCVDMT